jgi:hypothetical protein
MSTHEASRNRAGAVFSGQTARRRPDSPADQLQRLSSRLDELIRDVSLGTTSHRQHERNVDEAEAIATELRGVFRAPTNSQHAPLRQQGGRAWW